MANEESYAEAKRRSDEAWDGIEKEAWDGIEKEPGAYTLLSGDRPTGRLHLGHYFGTVKERVRLQDMGVNTNILIADYQVITDRDTTEHIQDNAYNMVLDYLAVGIDPERSMIFTHSAVPALNQLMLPFLSLVSESELHRNPTVKAEQEASGHALTGLLLTYPVHQACDILFCKAQLVPVGRDQLPHIEQTRNIARRFNERYGRVFPMPSIRPATSSSARRSSCRWAATSCPTSSRPATSPAASTSATAGCSRCPSGSSPRRPCSRVSTAARCPRATATPSRSR